ncbi:Clp1/GlmU family protein [Acidilobus saccharovorans]|uniref:Clp1/GlmU family protein n=1 Tax=Acidilobus saccharovorans TaxID=242703 RepID=UPI000A058BE2|nr:Clp1/GlmU family protein [Acidilobus saccharovorans]
MRELCLGFTLRLSGCVAVRGPSIIAVNDGDIRVLGAQVPPGSSLTVPVGRAVIVEGNGDLSVNGQLEPCDGESLKAIEGVVEEVRGARRIILVGPSDSGKSTLAAYLYNSGAVNSVISTDVGQNEVYCPGFEALSMPRRPFLPGSPQDQPLSACLVGDFTPRGLEGRYMSCAIRLSRLSGSFVIDTDGWVSQEGVELKAALSLAVNADAVVAIGLDSDAVVALRHEKAGPLVAVPRLAPASKSVPERRANRDRLIASCIMRSKRRTLRLEGLAMEGRGPGEDWQGLLVGLEGPGSDYFGVVERGPSRSGAITVISEYLGDVTAVKLGRARVDLGAFSGLIGQA